jgi:hypothetical protein
MYRALALSVLRGEAFVVHAKINYSFNEANNSGNERPAKKNVQNSLGYTAQVEFMNAEAAEKECKNRSSDSVTTSRSRSAKSPRRGHLSHTTPGTNFCVGTNDRTAVSAVLFVLAASNTVVH